MMKSITGKRDAGLDDEADAMWTTTIGDIALTYADSPGVLFMRLEVGDENYHLLITDDAKHLPKGSYVLVK
jgi:hypothetical protein